MLRNYIKISLRNLKKHSVFSLINILGLAVGVACTILISYYVRHERSYENFHHNSENIFRLSVDLYNGSEYVTTDVETYQLLGPEFKDKMPEVIDFVRIANWEEEAIMANNQTHYETGIYLADPSIFKIFTYPILEGDPYSSFDQPYKGVISKRLAIKYFGHVEVVGEIFKFGSSKEPVEIVGVLDDIPQNTHLKFNILISHASLIKNYWAPWYTQYPWGGNNEYTYLLMQEGVNLKAFNQKLRRYSLENEHINEEIIQAESINDIHLYSNKEFEPEVNGSAQTVDFLAIVAVFILIIAWVNYINLSTSRAINRAKEVGVRKVVGSFRKNLILQFLIEAFLVNLLACIIALTVVQISLPAFSQLTGQQLNSNILLDLFTWKIFLGILCIGTLLSGFYPAFILSSFKPAQVLKGKFANTSSGQLLRKGLVIFQFLSTVVLIAVSLAVYHQLDFMQKKDLGIGVDNTLVLRQSNLANGDSLYLTKTKAFVNDLRTDSRISSVAQSESMPAASLHDLSTNSGYKRVAANDQTGAYNYYIYDFNEEFIPTMKMGLIAGRNFNTQESDDRVIINERAVETLGFSSPKEAIGKKITPGGSYIKEIIGVVKNYNHRSPKEVHLPMIFNYEELGNHITVRLNTKNTKEALDIIKETWQKYYGNAVFSYYFLDDRYRQHYNSERVFSSVTILFTILSIIIAASGLFGLSTFTILQRTKEIGVRKVLGASGLSLTKLLSTDFLKLVLLAGVLAVPLAYLVIEKWLENYAVKIQLTWWLFIIPVILIVIIALVTILVQVIKSIRTNPVDSLRYE